MNQNPTLQRILARPWPAAAAYLGVLLLLLFVIVSTSADLFNRRAAVAASALMLDQFEGRKAPSARGRGGTDVTAPSGSPFLEGATLTVAGAVLLQRVTGAVTGLGGNVQSSQIDLQGTQSKAGFITMIASCDIEPSGLQRLLYDLEAGMPFLFVDQLVVQSQSGAPSMAEGRLRILLAVSGQWQGEK